MIKLFFGRVTKFFIVKLLYLLLLFLLLFLTQKMKQKTYFRGQDQSKFALLQNKKI